MKKLEQFGGILRENFWKTGWNVILPAGPQYFLIQQQGISPAAGADATCSHTHPHLGHMLIRLASHP